MPSAATCSRRLAETSAQAERSHSKRPSEPSRFVASRKPSSRRRRDSDGRYQGHDRGRAHRTGRGARSSCRAGQVGRCSARAGGCGGSRNIYAGLRSGRRFGSGCPRVAGPDPRPRVPCRTRPSTRRAWPAATAGTGAAAATSRHARGRTGRFTGAAGGGRLVDGRRRAAAGPGHARTTRPRWSSWRSAGSDGGPDFGLRLPDRSLWTSSSGCLCGRKLRAGRTGGPCPRLNAAST